MTTQTRNWADLGDEDEETFKPHHKEEKIVRTKTNGATPIEETVVQRKWMIPVRKQVFDRKKWAKFGEVANIPKGEHKPGDMELSNPVEIQTAGELQAEIGLVGDLMKMNTLSMMERREQTKLKNLEEGVDSKLGQKDAPTEEKKGGDSNKFTKNFTPGATGRSGRDDFSVKVSNITAVEREFKDIEVELNSFFSEVFTKIGVECRRMKYLSNRESQRFIGKAFFSFNSETAALKAMNELNGLDYNYSILEAEPADQQNDRPPRTDNRGGDKRGDNRGDNRGGNRRY
jgi:hypothetical protein